jgi:hypothetical protein
MALYLEIERPWGNAMVRRGSGVRVPHWALSRGSRSMLLDASDAGSACWIRAAAISAHRDRDRTAEPARRILPPLMAPPRAADRAAGSGPLSNDRSSDQ